MKFDMKYEEPKSLRFESNPLGNTNFPLTMFLQITT